jgi:hypothetical protein
MAIVTTAGGRVLRLVFGDDPAVKIEAGRRADLSAEFVTDRVREALAALPDGADAQMRAETAARVEDNLAGVLRVFVPASACEAVEGATVFAVRALSWAESEAARSLAADKQIAHVVATALQSIDGSEALAQAFLAQPDARLMVPLYRAVQDHTWGNSAA